MRKIVSNGKAAMAAKNPPLSTADGDVTTKSGPVENVFMAGPYVRMKDERTEYKCWAIVVLTHSGADAKDVEALHRGDARGNKVVTIEKWRLPDILRDANISETANQVFYTEDEADLLPMANCAMAFKKKIHFIAATVHHKMYIDVHFPNPISPDIHRLPFTEVEYILEDAFECLKCHQVEVLTSCPMQAFEVREVKTYTTDVETRSGRRMRAKFRSK